MTNWHIEAEIENENYDTKEFDMSLLCEHATMINFPKVYGGQHLIQITGARRDYTLLDFYCKNSGCVCTKAKFKVLFKGASLDDFGYDYITGELDDETRYTYLVEELENIEGFKEILAFRHRLAKADFELFRNSFPPEEIERLIAEKEKAEREAAEVAEKYTLRNNLDNYFKSLPSNNPTVGRNENCPCGSGKKYKKCCLKK